MLSWLQRDKVYLREMREEESVEEYSEEEVVEDTESRQRRGI